MLRLLHDMSRPELARPCDPSLFGGEKARPIGGCNCGACQTAREPARCEASFPWAPDECPNCGETDCDGEWICSECAAELADLEREIDGL